MDFVENFTCTLQENIQNISDIIDDSLKEEIITAKQEPEIFKKKYCTFNPNLEECTLKIKNLKLESHMPMNNLNKATVELNAKKETVLNLNQHFQKEFKEMEHQILLIDNQNDSTDINYNEILNNNQSLKNECDELLTSLSLYKNLLNVQSKLIEEQSYNVIKTKKLNETLKKDHFVLKKINEYMKESSYGLLLNISINKLSHGEIQKENVHKFNDMYKNYDKLLHMLEGKLLNPNEKLALQKEMKTKIPNVVTNLKQEVNLSTNSLDKELNSHEIVINEFKNKIDALTTNLANSLQQVKVSTKEFITERNYLGKIKIENQNGDCLKNNEELSKNYDSKSLNKYNDLYECTNSKSILKKMNQSLDCSSFKRNASLLRDIGTSNMKKRKISFEITTGNIKWNQSLKDKDTILNIDSNLTSNPQEEKFDMHFKSKNKIELESNVRTTTAIQKLYKIPDDIKPKSKFQLVYHPKDSNLFKPNSPVKLVAASKQGIRHSTPISSKHHKLVNYESN